MGYHTHTLELASDFQPLEGEANFGPTLTKEVVGGAHIAPHCITVEQGEYVLVDWKEGLPRHDKPGSRAIRFPHGLMMFGESFEDCAVRLVHDQLGMDVKTTAVVHVYSYLDDMRHWHMEPLILTAVEGQPAPPAKADVVRHSIGADLPPGAAWRGKPPFEQTYTLYLKDRLR